MVASLSYQKDSPNTFGTSLADSNVPSTEGSNLILVEQVGGAIQLEKTLPAQFKIVGAARVDNHSVLGIYLPQKLPS